MFRMWKWIRENIGKAIVLAALTASVTGWLRGTFDTILRESLPSGAEISCIGREWVVDHSPFRQLEPSKEVFRILLGTLDHDDANRTLTEVVVRAFQGEKGIEAVETCRVLKIEGGGDRIEEAAAKRGQVWLSRRDADVLVFGEWIEKGEALNLHFLAFGGSGDFHQHAFKLETGLLKGDFSEAMGAQLQAVALATVKPATEESGKYLVETLRPVAVRLEQLIHFPPSGLSTGQLADVQLALGLALSTIGDQAGDNKALTEAVAAYREALKERTRSQAPFDWAMTQNNLGNALWTLGERESGTARLEEAVAAYRAALEEYTRERVPLDWAGTQNNLGYALAMLGERESGTARLEEAIAVCRAALEVQSRDRVPLDWAATQDSLGAALKALGERGSGTARLEEAVAAYRAALEEYTRERVPLNWAHSLGNQGVALVLIADRNNDAVAAEAALRQIETAYETLHSGGQEQWSAEMETQLTKAQAIRDRLGGQ
jgi:tetratricopeptide (TPR) repeat protein